MITGEFGIYRVVDCMSNSIHFIRNIHTRVIRKLINELVLLYLDHFRMRNEITKASTTKLFELLNNDINMLR